MRTSAESTYVKRGCMHTATLQGWRQEFVDALRQGSTRHREPRDKRIKELERELARKETAALLTLKKKAHLIWGNPEGER